MKTALVTLSCAVGVMASTAVVVAPPAHAGGGTGIQAKIKNDGFAVKALTQRANWDADLPSGKKWGDAQPVSTGPRWEYRETLGCGSTSNPDAPNDLSSCSLALSRCTAGVNQLYLWRRIVGTTQWFFNGTTCGSANLPNTVSTPPPTPTLADILGAFRELPFAKPTVNIQPEGDVTLVNLSTYFEAQWPTGGLGPGDVSKPVQLLSWSVEFRIDPARYDFDFGDGSSTGWTTDRGGPHPDGGIRHTYDRARQQAQVKVDATLSGSYRVGGGAWVPLDGLADLQDEPVTTLEVREAKARLQTS